MRVRRQTRHLNLDGLAKDTIVGEVRRNEKAQISSGTKRDTVHKSNISERFRALLNDEAMQSSFALAHFKLSRFDRAGAILKGVKSHARTIKCQLCRLMR